MLPNSLKGEIAQYHSSLQAIRSNLAARSDAGQGAIAALIGDIDVTLGQLANPGLAETIDLSAMVTLEDRVTYLSNQAKLLLRVAPPEPVAS